MLNKQNYPQIDVTDGSLLAENLSKIELSEQTRQRVLASEVVLMPHSRHGEFGFAQETIRLFKYLRAQAGISPPVLAAEEGKIRYLQLHSNEIWMPMIQIAAEYPAQFGITINIISNYIYDLIKNVGGHDHSSTVRLEITCEERPTRISKTIKYTGPVTGLAGLPTIVMAAFDSKKKFP